MQQIEPAIGLVRQMLLLDQAGHDRQVHAVAKRAEDRVLGRQLVELCGHRVGPFLGQRIGLARVLAAAGLREMIFFGQALHARAAQLPGQPVLVLQQRLVVGRHPPPRRLDLRAGESICR